MNAKKKRLGRGLDALLGGSDIEQSSDTNSQESTPNTCLLYTSPSPRDQRGSRMPSSA